jgi:hypothetical protein
MPSLVEQDDLSKNTNNHQMSSTLEPTDLTSLNPVRVMATPSSTNFASSLNTKTNNSKCMCNNSASSLLVCSSSSLCANCMNNNELYIDSNSASSSSIGSMGGMGPVLVHNHPSSMTMPDSQSSTNINDTTNMPITNDIALVSSSNSTRSRSSSRSGGGTSSNSSLNTHNLIRDIPHLNNPRIGKHGKSKRCLNKRNKRPLSTSSAANTGANDTFSGRLSIKSKSGKKRSLTTPRYVPLSINPTSDDHST